MNTYMPAAGGEAGMQSGRHVLQGYNKEQTNGSTAAKRTATRAARPPTHHPPTCKG
jgi:hypothetical protein